jgi:hypothetical protein
MKRLRQWAIVGLAASLAATQAFAQSGVISGPPQVRDVPQRGPAPDRGPTPGPGPRSDVAPPPSVDLSWVAVAAGFKDGRWVRVGFARRNTSGDAESAALHACHGGPGKVRCENVFSSDRSCLYIAPGKRRGGVTWGRGATKDVALSECRRGGYTCAEKDVIGGCPDRPS